MSCFTKISYDRIVQSIWDADYVIAELTSSNANVAYELGIASYSK